MTVNIVQVLIHDEFTSIITLIFLLNISDKTVMPKIKKGQNIKNMSQ